MIKTNQVQLIGNLGNTPVLETINEKFSVLKFTLCTKDSYKDKAGEWQQTAEWHHIQLSNELAKAMENKIIVGDKVILNGKIRTHQFEKNQEKRFFTYIEANNIEVIWKKPC